VADVLKFNTYASAGNVFHVRKCYWNKPKRNKTTKTDWCLLRVDISVDATSVILTLHFKPNDENVVCTRGIVALPV